MAKRKLIKRGEVVSVAVAKSGKVYETVRHADGTHTRRSKGTAKKRAAKKGGRKVGRKRAHKAMGFATPHGFKGATPRWKKIAAGRRIGGRWGGETHTEFVKAGRTGARRVGKKGVARGRVVSRGPGETHLEEVAAGKKGARRRGLKAKPMTKTQRKTLKAQKAAARRTYGWGPHRLSDRSPYAGFRGWGRPAKKRAAKKRATKRRGKR